MGIYKRGKVYWYHFWFEGRHIQRSTKQRSRAKARRMEDTYKEDLRRGEAGIDDNRNATLRELAQKFNDSAQARCRPATASYYAEKMRRLLDSPLADKKLGKIDAESIEQYVQKRRGEVSIASVNRELATLKRALRLAQEWRMITRVPKIRMLRGEVPREFVLSHDDEPKYLGECSPSLRDVAVLILDTGLRAGEALNLEWKDVHFDPLKGARFGFIRITEGKSQNAKRNLSLTGRVRAMLEKRLKERESDWVFSGPKGGPMLVSSLDHLHDEARNKMGLGPEFVIHSLRHTFLTRLGESGADAFTIMKIAGHSSVVTSQRYVHPTPEALERAVERLDEMNASKRQ